MLYYLKKVIMEKIKNSVSVIENLLSNKLLARVMFILAMISFLILIARVDDTFAMQQLLWPSLSKFIIAIPFCIFHIIQILIYRGPVRYAQRNGYSNVIGWRTAIFSYFIYCLGMGILFLLVLFAKAIHIYSSIENMESKKPLANWFVWDVVTVFVVSIIAYLIPEDYHITMKSILGY